MNAIQALIAFYTIVILIGTGGHGGIWIALIGYFLYRKTETLPKKEVI